jgi:uncharacterized membrane protein
MWDRVALESVIRGWAMNDLQERDVNELDQPGETPDQDERTMATLAHVLQLVGGCIAPLVIFLVKRESRFVKFHALQALLLQVVYLVVFGVLMVSWFALIFSTIVLHPPAKGAPPPAIFLVLPLVWIGTMGLWALTLALAVVFGIKAGRGEWAEYPLLGRWARRMLKIGPDGRELVSGMQG